MHSPNSTINRITLKIVCQEWIHITIRQIVLLACLIYRRSTKSATDLRIDLSKLSSAGSCACSCCRMHFTDLDVCAGKRGRLGSLPRNSCFCHFSPIGATSNLNQAWLVSRKFERYMPLFIEARLPERFLLLRLSQLSWVYNCSLQRQKPLQVVSKPR